MREQGWFVSVFFLCALSGCDAPLLDPPEDAPASNTGAAAEGPPLTMDEVWARLAASKIPGFAGHAIEEDGTSVVYLTPNGARAAALRYVGGYRTRRGLGAASVRLAPVRYDFRQLKTWADALMPVLGRPGFVLMDIEEGSNRILVGVTEAAEMGAVRRYAGAAGIPMDALEVKIVSAPAPRAATNPTINSEFRPVQGGVGTINAAKGGCTIGFNAIYTGGWFDPQSIPGFITASHCSATSFGSDYSVQYQPAIRSTAYRIGTEFLDPPSHSCSWIGYCFARRSDAAFFKYDSLMPFEVGYIAKTTSAGIGTFGTGWIDLVNPRFEITASAWQEETVVGTWLNKVGSTTGWTRGQVTQTCVVIGWLNCQFVTNIYSEQGDSGSPIFEDGSSTSTPAGTQVKLHGILWGGPYGNWNETWFSHVAGISADLGFFCVTSTC